jgi:hypothetical protein
MSNYNDPLRSIELLGRLQALGFSGFHFIELHHFPKKQKTTIDDHIKYCKGSPGAFSSSGNNAKLQERLEWMLSEKTENPGARFLGLVNRSKEAVQ